MPGQAKSGRHEFGERLCHVGFGLRSIVVRPILQTGLLALRGSCDSQAIAAAYCQAPGARGDLNLTPDPPRPASFASETPVGGLPSASTSTTAQRAGALRI